MSNQLNVYNLEPGLYLTEAATPPPAPSGIAQGVAGMFGKAPWGPINTLTEVSSFAEFQRIFFPGGGYDNATYPVYKQVYKYFKNGGQILQFSRLVHYTDITDPSTYTATYGVASIKDVSSADRIVVKGKYQGDLALAYTVEEGSNAVSGEFKLAVKKDGVMVEPVYDNLALTSTSPNYFLPIINNLSKYIQVFEASGTRAISIALSSMATLVSGSGGLTTLGTTDYIGDGTALTGLKVFNGIDTPVYIACPDAMVTTDATVRKEIARYVDNDHLKLHFGVIVMPNAKSVAAALSYMTATMATDATRCAMYYPWVIDEDDGSVISPEGAILGVYAKFANDLNKGVWFSPAGTEAQLLGVTGLESVPGSVGAGKLNEKNVNCLKTIPGLGVVIWGSRTMAIAKQRDFKYIGARLNTSDIEARILKNTLWAVQMPNDKRLWSQISSTVNDILSKRYNAGGFDGRSRAESYIVICDSTVNGEAEKQAGLVVCQIGIKNKQTAEFIWFNVAQMSTGGVTNEG